jgi:gamma-glutamyltranspeptidase/glutathione hydrolase
MKRALAALLVASIVALPLSAGSQTVATHAALSTISPIATSVGLGVLRGNGNAIDAAVAVSFALAVAHPQAGNIGGGGFLMYYEAKTRSVWALDYREVAPLDAKRDLYVQANGDPNLSVRTGPLSAGVPAAVAGLAEMHHRFGHLPWAELVAPAIGLARDGFAVDLQLSSDLVIAAKDRHIDQFPSTTAVFYPEGKAVVAGARLVQTDLARTLERIAQGGAADFYDGGLAGGIVKAVKGHGGLLSLRDLREYKPVWRAPIRIDSGVYSLYTMPPPSGGAIVLGESLAILSGLDLAASGQGTSRTIHLIAEAERRAYIDRNRYLGDPAVSRIPYHELFSDQHLKRWRATIDPARATPTSTLAAPDQFDDAPHTTHFSVVDAEGNIAAITTTLNENFGSGFVVPGAGFFLNNDMDDFTVTVGKPNAQELLQSEVNAIAPQKRMASSMTPTIILKNNAPWLVLGTRGGATIPTTVLQVFLNMTVFGASLYDAVAAPRFHEQALPDVIYYERGRVAPALIDQIAQLGHSVKEREPIGDVHAILIEGGKLTAVADPRNGGASGGY